MFAAKDTLLTRPSTGGYQISRSLRFNSADSAYLNRTPASAGNRQIFTWSGWVKRSALGSSFFGLFGASTGANTYTGYWLRNDNLWLYSYTNPTENYSYQTTQLFRDVSAWYHLVIATDTTQATNTNRIKIYVNGSQVTALTVNTYPTQNFNDYIDNNVAHTLGWTDGGTGYYNGYMTEVNFIDGQALTPSSFGSTNADTGVWQPKAFSGGAYGTNGFYVNFSDNSNTTAATLGADYSGNGNNWTPNGFSVTAGVGNDSLVDSPTSYGTDTGVGGSVRGNYCTLNPLSNGGATLANGNLQFSFASAANWITCNSTMGMSSGKWYWEVSPTSTGGTLYCQVGINRNWANDLAIPLSSNVYGYSYSAHNGNKGNNGAGSAYGSTWTVNDIIGIAFDADAGTLTFYKNNTSQGAAYSGLASGDYVPAVSLTETQTAYINLGQRPFAYTAPSGYKALCTQNLPTPTIGATTATQAGKYFNAVTYTGTGSSLGVTGVGFQPDWVWVKGRSGATDHGLYDAVRGVQKQLESNNTDAETTETTGITAFGSDGFTTGALAQLNTSAATYVAWNWKANGAGSSNTAGSITSTVSANTTSGFSVVTYTNASSGTVGHGLGVAPAMVIYKDRTNVTNWVVLHQSLASMSNSYLVLNLTNAVATGITLGGSPTSSVIYTNTNIIQNGAASVAYCFAEIAGYSKFGSYTGNADTNGPFVYTGFRPAFVLIKQTSLSGNNWFIYDSTRSTSNLAQQPLLANASDSELNSSSYGLDLLSNGFKIRTTDTNTNQNGQTYIFMALASAPLKFSLAR